MKRRRTRSQKVSTWVPPSMQWNKELGKMIMVQSFASPRFGVLEDKLKEPEGVNKLRNLTTAPKGFKVL